MGKAQPYLSDLPSQRPKVNPDALGVPLFYIHRGHKTGKLLLRWQAGILWLYGSSGRLLAAYSSERVAMDDIARVLRDQNVEYIKGRT